MTIANVIIFSVLMAILWNILEINRNQRATNKTLEIIDGLLQSILAHTEHSNEKELNTIRAINEMCSALNQSFSSTNAFMNHTSYALKNIAVCMVPFIDNIKERAIAAEEYEKVQECINIINNLKEIIKPNK